MVKSVPGFLNEFGGKLILPGVIAIQQKPFANYDTAQEELTVVNEKLKNYAEELNAFPIIILCDDANFVAKKLNNFCG